jgi:hypothetical protein
MHLVHNCLKYIDQKTDTPSFPASIVDDSDPPVCLLPPPVSMSCAYHEVQEVESLRDRWQELLELAEVSQLLLKERRAAF